MAQQNAKLNVTTEQIKDCIISALQDKKAIDIVELDLSALKIALFDKFIICTATSNIHAQALCDHVLLTLKQQLRVLPKGCEGVNNAQWILIDYFDIIVHVFLSESRSFYDVESLWRDAPCVHYE
jgi:ribosome-associated protein